MRIDSLRKEISILSKLDHHGVMRFYDSIDSGNKINIVVEYINGNNIFQYIRKLP
jgi:serine/threonine protein kinase